MSELNSEHLKKDINEDSIDLEYEEGLRLSEFISILKKRWLLIISITIIFAIISVIYSLSLPNYYKSTASVYVFSNNRSSALYGFIKNFKSDSINNLEEISLLKTSLESETMSEYVINKFGIATNPAIVGDKIIDEKDINFDKVLKIYKRIVSINNDSQNKIISISAETMNASVSADIVNVYLSKLEDFTNNPQKEKLLFIEQQLAKVKDDLKICENQLREYQEENKLYSLEKQSSKNITKLANLEYQKNDAELNIGWLKYFSENSKELNNKSEIFYQIEAEKEKAKAIQNKIDVLEKELSELPNTSLELSRLRRNLAIKEKLFEVLSEQYEIAKIAYAEEGCQYRIIDRPRVAKIKSKPARTGICVFITFLGFIISISFVLIEEFSSKKKEAVVN